MADKLAELYVEITARTDKLQSELTGVKGKLAQAQTGFNKLNTAVGGLLPAATVGAVVVGFTQMMNSSAAFGEEITLAAQKTGLTTDMLQDLNYLAKTTNSSLGGLEAGMRKMNMTISDGLAGNKTAVETFQKLGISVDSLRTMNSDQRFKAIAAAIALIPDPAVRAAMAVDVLGRSGVDLIPLIEAMRSMPDMKVPKLSEAELKSLDDAKTALEKLDYAWTITQGKFASAIFPQLTPFLADINNLVGLLTGLLTEWNKLPPQLRVLLGGGGSPVNAAMMLMGKPSGSTVRWAGAKAEGGIVTQPSLAMVGEAGPEAIIPLSQMGGMGGNSVTVNVGNYMGDEISKRALVRDIQRILNEENRRSTHKPTETNYYSVGGHL